MPNRCRACGCERESSNPDIFQTHSLAVWKGCSVQEAIDKHNAPDLLSDDFHDAPCLMPCPANLGFEKASTVYRPPAVLAINFKLWTAAGEKSNVEVVPEVGIVFHGVAYTLQSVVCHKGPSAARGHYYAFTRHACIVGERKWWLYDDCLRRIAHDSEVEIFRQRQDGSLVYMAFYEQADVAPWDVASGFFECATRTAAGQRPEFRRQCRRSAGQAQVSRAGCGSLTCQARRHRPEALKAKLPAPFEDTRRATLECAP